MKQALFTNGRVYVDGRGKGVSQDTICYGFFCAYTGLDVYLPGLRMVLFQGVSPEELLGEKKPEAEGGEQT